MSRAGGAAGPEATANGLTRLRFVPAPTQVRRAIAVWQRIN